MGMLENSLSESAKQLKQSMVFGLVTELAANPIQFLITD
jgi:hypothetical protein